MTENAIRWFEIYVENMDRAKKFYESVFRVKLENIASHDLEMWCFPMQINQVGCAGALARMDGMTPGGNSTIVYFACEDCAVEEALARGHGGRIHKPKTSIGEYGFISLVHDTEDNMIGLHSMK